MDTSIGAELDMIGIVVTDMTRSLAFYRLLGLEFPEGSETEAHVETTLRGGVRLALDLQSMVEGFHPGVTPDGHGRVGLPLLLAADGREHVVGVHQRLVGLAPGPPARGADAAAEGPRRRGGVGGGEGLDEVAGVPGVPRGELAEVGRRVLGTAFRSALDDGVC